MKKTNIIYENCSQTERYLFECDARSHLTFLIESKYFPTQQTRNKELAQSIKERIQSILSPIIWINVGEVNLSLTWYLSAYQRALTDKIGDLDNLSKPIIDSLLGLEGIILDDSQVSSLTSMWISKDVSKKSDAVLRIDIDFCNDNSLEKGSLVAISLSKKNKLYFVTDIQDYKIIKTIIDQKVKAINIPAQNQKTFSHSQRENFTISFLGTGVFHRSRLNCLNDDRIWDYSKLEV